MVQRFDFKKKLNNTGEYLFMPFNLFSAFEKNPFIADTRASDIYFGANQQVVLIGSYKIPDTYVIETLLKNTRMIMPDTSIVFSRIGSFEDGVFSIRVTVDFKRPIFVKDDYPYFQEFYNKLFELLNEPLILKKK